MTQDEAAQALAEMTAQREQERADDAEHYRLRKACAVRAVELFYALKYEAGRSIPAGTNITHASIDQLINDIEKDAQS